MFAETCLNILSVISYFSDADILKVNPHTQLAVSWLLLVTIWPFHCKSTRCLTELHKPHGI